VYGTTEYRYIAGVRVWKGAVGAWRARPEAAPIGITDQLLRWAEDTLGVPSDGA
jgi:hypothetical protein